MKTIPKEILKAEKLVKKSFKNRDNRLIKQANDIIEEYNKNNEERYWTYWFYINHPTKSFSERYGIYNIII
jgi:hypothetical protein